MSLENGATGNTTLLDVSEAAAFLDSLSKELAIIASLTRGTPEYTLSQVCYIIVCCKRARFSEVQ